MDMNTSVPTNDNSYVMDIDVEGMDTVETLDLAQVPMDVRIHLLKTAARSYVHNRVSTAAAKTKKDNESWAIYEAACAHDPLQTTVPKPDTDKVVTDYKGIVAGAINALLTGQLGRKGTGKQKPKVLRDPIITQVTRAVVAKVYKDNVALDPSYKYPTAQKEVGNNGYDYLRAVKLPEWMAAGGTEADFNKVVETKYTKPARLMLGLDVPKSLADMGDIL